MDLDDDEPSLRLHLLRVLCMLVDTNVDEFAFGANEDNSKAITLLWSDQKKTAEEKQRKERKGKERNEKE